MERILSPASFSGEFLVIIALMVDFSQAIKRNEPGCGGGLKMSWQSNDSWPYLSLLFFMPPTTSGLCSWLKKMMFLSIISSQINPKSQLSFFAFSLDNDVKPVMVSQHMRIIVAVEISLPGFLSLFTFIKLGEHIMTRGSNLAHLVCGLRGENSFILTSAQFTHTLSRNSSSKARIRETVNKGDLGT